MKRAIAAVAALVVMCGLFSPIASRAAVSASRPTVKISPAGQITVATINARQNKILSLQRIEAMFELSRAFRFRPHAFNGGTQGGVFAPDIVVASEILEDNVNVFTRFLRNKFDEPYEIVGPGDVQAALIVNTRTVEMQGEVKVLDDVCFNDQTSENPRLHRQYPMASFREVSTNSPFSVVGVHLSREYQISGQQGCLLRNIREIRTQLETEPGATFVAGDFNFRPTALPYECDPYEQGEPSEWWTVMTTGDDGGRQYLDSVQSFHRARSLSMFDQWTYQHPARVVTCNGSSGVRRSRIDYIFSSGAQVADAHVDNPGWTDPDNYKYSDHRFIVGRFVLSGPPRVQRPDATQAIGGAIQLSWTPVEGASGYIVYRAFPGYDYTELATVDGAFTTYEDRDTAHAESYRYAIVAVGVDSGEGIESAPNWQTADARGPHVTGIVPIGGAMRVSPTASIRASFDEWVDSASVNSTTIALYRNGNRIPGRVVRKGGFVIKFNPTYSLKKGETFTVVVRSVRDVLGNSGPVFRSRFSTVEPPKRRRNRR